MFCEPCTVISGLERVGEGGGLEGGETGRQRGVCVCVWGGGGNRQLGICGVSGVCWRCGAAKRTLSLYFSLGVLFFVFVFIFHRESALEDSLTPGPPVLTTCVSPLCPPSQQDQALSASVLNFLVFLTCVESGSRPVYGRSGI